MDVMYRARVLKAAKKAGWTSPLSEPWTVDGYMKKGSFHWQWRSKSKREFIWVEARTSMRCKEMTLAALGQILKVK